MSNKISRGTFGFIKFFYSCKPKPMHAVVIHVFPDGRLLVQHEDRNEFRDLITPDNFTPSRDAVFGSLVGDEPDWDGDSARCKNVWMEELGGSLGSKNVNGPENLWTDAEAARYLKRFVTLTNPETTKKLVKSHEFFEGDGIPERLDGDWIHIQEVIGLLVHLQKQLGIRRVWVDNGMLALAITPDKATVDTGAILQSWCDKAGTAIRCKGATQPEYDAEGNVLVYLRRD